MKRNKKLDAKLYSYFPIAFVFFLFFSHGQAINFLPNQDFDEDLKGWFTAFENPISTVASFGTVEWSSDFNGSAHLTVSGAPGVADLITCINTTIYPGDIITCKVTTGNMKYAGIHLYIGDYFNDINEHVDIIEVGNVTRVMRLVANKKYQPGTPILIHLVCWPGSGEAWIHYLDLIRGD